jgi:hypothetical protein
MNTMHAGTAKRGGLVWLLTGALAMIFSTAGAAAPAGPAGGSEIVARIVNAYGGTAALGNVRSLYTKGYLRMYQGGADGWVTTYYRRPDSLRVENKTQNIVKTRILRGTEAWQRKGTAPAAKLAPPLFEGMVLQRSVLDLPFGLNDGSLTASPVTADSGELVLAIKDKGGRAMTAVVDAGTGLVSSISTTISNGGKSSVVGFTVSAYRDVDGVKIPFVISHFYNGKQAAETRLSEADINRAMPDKLFRP